MTTQSPSKDSLESCLKESQVEKDLLLAQIHQLEEELEHYFKRNQELENSQQAGTPMDGTGKVFWIDDDLPSAIAEKLRLRALVDVMGRVHQLENNNALSVKLGNILIHAVDSPGALLALPSKLGKIWRESRRSIPPADLGGKGFEKVIAAYSDGGFKAVEELLAKVPTAPAMQANAYTAIARQLMNSDSNATAQAARCAYELDPRFFRLKWLAFRLHEAGEIIEAEAILDILPPDINFSESEQRQASQLCSEAKQVLLHEAKQKIRFSERRSKVEKKISELTQAKNQEAEENELLLQQMFLVQEELESQCLKCEKIELENTELVEKSVTQVQLLTDSQVQIDELKQDNVFITRQKNEQEKLLLEHLNKINELEQLLDDKQKSTTKADLSGYKQMINEEMVRTEAQLDLIKDILLRQSGI